MTDNDLQAETGCKMILWICPAHGLNGPKACCNLASPSDQAGEKKGPAQLLFDRYNGIVQQFPIWDKLRPEDRNLWVQISCVLSTIEEHSKAVTYAAKEKSSDQAGDGKQEIAELRIISDKLVKALIECLAGLPCDKNGIVEDSHSGCYDEGFRALRAYATIKSALDNTPKSI